jgi:hypothetical protein
MARKYRQVDLMKSGKKIRRNDKFIRNQYSTKFFYYKHNKIETGVEKERVSA